MNMNHRDDKLETAWRYSSCSALSVGFEVSDEHGEEMVGIQMQILFPISVSRSESTQTSNTSHSANDVSYYWSTVWSAYSDGIEYSNGHCDNDSLHCAEYQEWSTTKRYGVLLRIVYCVWSTTVDGILELKTRILQFRIEVLRGMSMEY